MIERLYVVEAMILKTDKSYLYSSLDKFWEKV